MLNKFSNFSAQLMVKEGKVDLPCGETLLKGGVLGTPD